MRKARAAPLLLSLLQPNTYTRRPPAPCPPACRGCSTGNAACNCVGHTRSLLRPPPYLPASSPTPSFHCCPDGFPFRVPLQHPYFYAAPLPCPLEDMPSSYVQHGPNNYINGWVGNPKEINFVFNSAQWEEVVQRCTGEMMFGHHPSQILRPSAIHILPNDVPHPCRRCFRQSKNAEIQVTHSLDLNGASGMARNLTVLAKCDGGQWPKWP